MTTGVSTIFTYGGEVMKKFIVYLMVIVLTVSLGFAVYYLVDNNEVISISTASIYTDVDKEFSIDVTAEAIQSKNFTPNFSANSTEPWPGITASDIQECIYPDHVKYESNL